jgi:protein-disulfide isomerase
MAGGPPTGDGSNGEALFDVANELSDSVESAEAAGAVRRTLSRRLGIIVAIVVASSVVILIATGGSSKKATPKPNGTQAQGTDAGVTSLLAGIPQRGNTLGDPKAPVTLQYFGDLQCPFCKQFTLGALPSIIERWVRSGKLKIEYRSIETATREPEVFKAQQVAALAAGEQNKMWYFIELFYHEQGNENSGYVVNGYLQGLAQQVPGLNLIAWTAARDDTELANTITNDAQAAGNAGFTGTPSFLLGRTGGTLQSFRQRTNTDPAPYNAAIEELLRLGPHQRLPRLAPAPLRVRSGRGVLS